MKTNWNNGMNYGFSVIKAMMWMVGVWPLQQNHIVCTIRWFVIFIIGSLTVIGLLIEISKNCGDTKDALDVFLVVETGFHAWINIVSARIYMKKIAINVISAIDDWSYSSTEKQSYLIMARYARIGRVIAVAQLMIGFLAGVVYFPTIILGNKRNQVVTIGNDTITLWNFVIPSTCLYQGVSHSTFQALFLMQILQGFIIFVAECASDCFFFAITMHLCGQLELLRIRFVEIVERKTDENHYRSVLGSWIRRHYKLIILAKNIEDTFNFNILIRLVITTIVVAVSGMRFIVSIKHHNYINVVKSMIFVQFFIVQTFLFTHAGETLQKQSESIVSAIYGTTWHELPSIIVKDLTFIMMRTRIPLQLTAGKFFYITRRTTTDILKTALTYVSFLQVTMEEL